MKIGNATFAAGVGGSAEANIAEQAPHRRTPLQPGQIIETIEKGPFHS
jgi:hypothetical protein